MNPSKPTLENPQKGDGGGVGNNKRKLADASVSSTTSDPPDNKKERKVVWNNYSLKPDVLEKLKPEDRKEYLPTGSKPISKAMPLLCKLGHDPYKSHTAAERENPLTDETFKQKAKANDVVAYYTTASKKLGVIYSKIKKSAAPATGVKPE